MEDLICEKIQSWRNEMKTFKMPNFIIVNKRDYKEWILHLKFTTNLIFSERLRDHRLKCYGVRVLYSTQLKRGEIVVG